MSKRDTPAGKKKLLAISSGGGHWVQLLRLRPAFEDCDVIYATVSSGYRVDIGDEKLEVISDATRWSKIALVKSALSVLRLILRERPDVVVSTGAAPGFFAILFSKVVGARSIWVDSVANAEELSLSGQKAGKHADMWLTQWPHLAKPNGPDYIGKVL